MDIPLINDMWSQETIKLLKSKTVKLTPEQNQDLFLNDFIEALTIKHSEKRTGIHVSDLAGQCFKKKVYETIPELQDKPSEDQVMYFTTGSAVHGVKQDLAETLSKEKYSREKAVNHEEGLLEGHIDLFNNFEDMPIELKTTRQTADMHLKNGPNEGYLLQLAMYLALTNTEEGLLEYILLAQKVTGFYHGYVLSLTKEDRELVLKEAVKLARLLKRAIESKDPDMVKGAFEDPVFSWQCKTCPFASENLCKGGHPIRQEYVKKMEERMSKIKEKEKQR